MNMSFDDTYFEDDVLCLYKGTGEESGFILKLGTDYMELWAIPQYGGKERLEKSWDYSNPIEAVQLALTWT